MLVLTRKANESIMIGDEIEVTVCQVVGEKVRLGIEAPRTVPVHRKEIYRGIHTVSEEEIDPEAVDEALTRLKGG